MLADLWGRPTRQKYFDVKCPDERPMRRGCQEFKKLAGEFRNRGDWHKRLPLRTWLHICNLLHADGRQVRKQFDLSYRIVCKMMDVVPTARNTTKHHALELDATSCCLASKFCGRLASPFRRVLVPAHFHVPSRWVATANPSIQDFKELVSPWNEFNVRFGPSSLLTLCECRVILPT